MAAEPGTLLCSTVTRQKPAQRQVFVTQGPENRQTFFHGFFYCQDTFYKDTGSVSTALQQLRFLQMQFNIVK